MEKSLNEFVFRITSYTDLLFTSWTDYWDIVEIQYIYIQSYEEEKKKKPWPLSTGTSAQMLPQRCPASPPRDPLPFPRRASLSSILLLGGK